jgi:hypothetical protein
LQAYRVVVVHELGDQPPGVLHAQRRRDADASSSQGLEPAFDLAVALERVTIPCSSWSGSRRAD